MTGLTNPAWFSTSVGGDSNEVIQGNHIGTDATGSLALPNVDGVVVDASDNTIGGTAAGAGNTIAQNTGTGVVIAVGKGNALEANAIFANTILGIDLGGNGVTANTGRLNAEAANSGMNFPVFTQVSLVGTSLSVSGYIGTAPGQTAFAGARVEVFESDNSSSGYGQGETYLGFLTASSSGSFSGSLTVAGLVVGDHITGTATDSTGDTSEFAANANVPDYSTTTTLASSASSSVYGQSVTFTATAAAIPAAAGPPTGTVTFLDGSTVLGTATLSGGTATFATSSLTAGSDSITAQYGGAAQYLTSSSSPVIETVAAASLTVTANSPSKVYGAALPALTYTYSGLVNGDTTSVSPAR